MTKRIGLLALALILSAAAVTTTGYAAPKPSCTAPACFRTPGCCTNAECDSFCGGTGFGVCIGVSGPDGGCCECAG